ncbi:phosphotransferase [bacterium]|nr:phosphotransferase [bacterium]
MEEKDRKIWELAQEAFGLDSTPFTKLGIFESEIWEVQKQCISFILRITDTTHRQPENLVSEAVWIEYLAKNGIPVAIPIQTLTKDYLVTLKDPPCYLMLFQKATGHAPTHKDATDSFIMSWGEIMGKMHRLASVFSPPVNFSRTNLITSFTSLWLSVSNQVDPSVEPYYASILQACYRFPVDPQHYGLIHYDLHMGNFFVDDGKMTIFDFDDMQYGWYVYDIAMALYYWFWGADRKGSSLSTNQTARAEDAVRFLRFFLSGYTKEFPLPDKWLEMMPIFLVIRQMELYFVFESRFGTITDESSPLSKLKQFFQDQVVNKKPHIPLEVFKKDNFKDLTLYF